MFLSWGFGHFCLNHRNKVFFCLVVRGLVVRPLKEPLFHVCIPLITVVLSFLFPITHLHGQGHYTRNLTLYGFPGFTLLLICVFGRKNIQCIVEVLKEPNQKMKCCRCCRVYFTYCLEEKRKK